MAVYLKAAFALGLLLAAAPAALAQPIGRPGPDTIEPDTDENLQYAAAVASVHGLTHQGDASVTIFSTVGGDPAMNGEYVFLAFDGSSADGARIFRICDILDYHIISETPGRVLLQVRENVMGDGGEIGTRDRHIAITWRPGADGAAPASVTVATAP